MYFMNWGFRGYHVFMYTCTTDCVVFDRLLFNSVQCHTSATYLFVRPESEQHLSYTEVPHGMDGDWYL